MSDQLSERQTKLLRAVIEEYITTSEPVGSQNLVERYNLKVSPATVRNEMAALMEMGYLTQPHTSGGRVPTDLGLRFYINSLMEEVELPVLQEVSLKQRLWQERFDLEKMLRQAVVGLAEITSGLAVVQTSDERLLASGMAKILDYPEFFDIDVTRAALHLADDHELCRDLFGKAKEDQEVTVLIGEELGLSNLKACGLILAPFAAGKVSGVVGVLGPDRMNYAQIIPAVRYVGRLLSEVGQSW